MGSQISYLNNKELEKYEITKPIEKDTSNPSITQAIDKPTLDKKTWILDSHTVKSCYSKHVPLDVVSQNSVTCKDPVSQIKIKGCELQSIPNGIKLSKNEEKENRITTKSLQIKPLSVSIATQISSTSVDKTSSYYRKHKSTSKSLPKQKTCFQLNDENNKRLSGRGYSKSTSFNSHCCPLGKMGKIVRCSHRIYQSPFCQVYNSVETHCPHDDLFYTAHLIQQHSPFSDCLLFSSMNDPSSCTCNRNNFLTIGCSSATSYTPTLRSYQTQKTLLPRTVKSRNLYPWDVKFTRECSIMPFDKNSSLRISNDCIPHLLPCSINLNVVNSDAKNADGLKNKQKNRLDQLATPMSKQSNNLKSLSVYPDKVEHCYMNGDSKEVNDETTTNSTTSSKNYLS